MATVRSISKKNILSQTSVLGSDNSTWSLDTFDGISGGRFETQRSLRRDVRRLLAANSDGTVRLNTTAGTAMKAVRALTAGSATNAQIVNAVKNALTAVASAQHLGDDGPALASSRSFEQMLSDITFVLGDGTLCLDDVGILGTTNQRSKPSVSLRDNLRRACRKNATGSTIRVQTASGLIIKAMGSTSTVTAPGIVTAAQGAISSSTISTPIVSVSAQVPTTSLLDILNALVVTGTGSVKCIDDTGEVSATRTAKTRNLKNLLKNLTSAATGTDFMLRTTSGQKVRAVDALTAGSATSAQIQAAINTAI